MSHQGSSPRPVQPREALSPAERRFERVRGTLGLVAGPLAFAAILVFPPSAMPPAAARLAAVVAWVLIWWITEAIPIPATALLGPAIAVVLGVLPAREMFAPFGDPIIFLFLGGFLIAEGMSVHGLDRRIAAAILAGRVVRGRPERVLPAFFVLAAGLSMWISNTATTAMLYPIAAGIGGSLVSRAARRGDPRGAEEGGERVSLLLGCAYGSSIGGIVTPVGSPPNLIAIANIAKLAERRVTFLEWMILAAPVAIVMLLIAMWYLRRRFPRSEAAREPIPPRDEPRTRLGRGEGNVILAFSVAVTLWIAPGVAALARGHDDPFVRRLTELLPEGVVALMAAGLLFVLPVDWRGRKFTLTWSDASRVDWGTLMLFGGGLALGGAMFKTGLATSVGDALTGATGATSTLALTFLFGVTAIWMTEVTSNTATATMLVPLAVAAAASTGADPIPPAVACAVGCSLAFMLPVATPPNAIVYGSGIVRLPTMARAGFWMNLTASLVMPPLVYVVAGVIGL